MKNLINRYKSLSTNDKETVNFSVCMTGIVAAAIAVAAFGTKAIIAICALLCIVLLAVIVWAVLYFVACRDAYRAMFSKQDE